MGTHTASSEVGKAMVGRKGSGAPPQLQPCQYKLALTATPPQDHRLLFRYENNVYFVQRKIE